MPDDVPKITVSRRDQGVHGHSVAAMRSQLVDMIGRLDSQAVVHLWHFMLWWTSPRRRAGPCNGRRGASGPPPES